MAWAVGIQEAPIEVFVVVGGSNVGAHSATSPDPTYSSGAHFAEVDLATPVAGVQFATYKEMAVLTGTPVSRTWGNLEPYGEQDGEPIAGLELALGRYLLDRGRNVAILTYAIGSIGAVDLVGAEKAAFEAFVLAQLALLTEPCAYKGTIPYMYNGDTASEADALAYGGRILSIHESLCAAIGPRANGAALMMIEPHADRVAGAGEWGPTALASLDAAMASVTSYPKHWIPTNAAAADGARNSTGTAVTAVEFGTLHPGSATQDALGHRAGLVLEHNHVIAMYSIGD